MIIPNRGCVLLTPSLNSENEAKSVMNRSGIYLPKPDGKYSFEGVPNQGFVFALPLNYEGELRVGQRVAFSEKQPKGFKNPEDKAQTLFSVKLSQVIATISEDTEVVAA